MERHLAYALANILATKWMNLGDVLSMDWDENDLCLAFDRIAGGTAVPTDAEQRSAMAAGAESTGRDETTSGVRRVPDAIWRSVRKPASKAVAPLGDTRANTAAPSLGRASGGAPVN
jgi:hypothetical protein